MVSEPPQVSLATTAALLGNGTAPAHDTVMSLGILEMIGGTVSLTITLVVQLLGHPPMLPVTFRVKVNGAPQTEPAFTVTTCELFVPEMEPLPAIPQE